MTKKIMERNRPVYRLCRGIAVDLRTGRTAERIPVQHTAGGGGLPHGGPQREIRHGAGGVGVFFVLFERNPAGWRIHPVQYLLVGAALSIFYLLLLSLAEHIGFTAAYAIGAAACIGLLFWYLRFVLATTRGVYMMTALLVAAYGTMFVLIKMQQYNLLAGSCLLFAALFAVMYYTRGD